VEGGLLKMILSFMKWDNLTPVEIVERIDVLIFCITIIYEIFIFTKDRVLLSLAGRDIFKKTNNHPPFGNYIKLFIATVLILGLHVIVSNIMKDTMLLISKTTIISFLLIYTNRIFFTNINGIYENGIIQKKFIAWKKIFSYYYFQDNAVTFFIHKKIIKNITMKIEAEDIDILNKYLINKNIGYRNVCPEKSFGEG
jgi:hypothetical protein